MVGEESTEGAAAPVYPLLVGVKEGRDDGTALPGDRQARPPGDQTLKPRVRIFSLNPGSLCAGTRSAAIMGRR